MKVQLLVIRPTQEAKTFDIEVSVGNDRHTFPITIHEGVVPVANSNKNYEAIFQAHPKIAMAIFRLAYVAYKGEPLDLPVDVGEL